ncbi:LuxR C-terminal-related transcriptional regulator [Paraburkholderia sp. J63]|uniref:LuxR C-terminal-related transcriptional regulator n=1 Tax=Paraburkholderia sp. J63 TaxID=2805434 RepID=UPI002ABD59AE|nr:LuxR C-terminal-related transcriptional regulator [Paraburkholderia sp. J63]
MTETCRMMKARLCALEAEAEALRRRELPDVVADMRQKIRDYGITPDQLFVDFLLKPFDMNVLLCALEAALSLRESRVAPRAPSVSLSERERFVLSAIASGLRNKEIAHELQLSERTIKHCRAARRAGVRSSARGFEGEPAARRRARSGDRPVTLHGPCACLI